MAETAAKIAKIRPDDIIRNPDNPRLIFREEEMQILLDSIHQVGIQVPITVYWEDSKKKYALIDGERRWRCARKLNEKEIPAIIYPKPSPLENILRMFNIHNVRREWDLLPTALKLKEVKKLLKKQLKREPKAKDLSVATGVSLATVRRAEALLNIPQKYQNMLLKELKKPKSKQEITEDLFLEMAKALNAMEKYVPEIMEDVPKVEIIDAFVAKYKQKIIKNIVRFRDVSKIARAEKADVARQKVVPILIKLIKKPKYTIEEAYNDSVAVSYEIRGIVTQIKALNKRLNTSLKYGQMSKTIKKELKYLLRTINKIIG